MLLVGTTFSGIGAPEQALKNLGVEFKTLWACDISKQAKEVYLANHTASIWLEDITKIAINNLPYVDLYVFGFPCQDVSVSGKKNLQTGRTTLVGCSLDIIDKIKPKYILFENVKGLLSGRFDEFYSGIVNRLKENYDLHIKVLNSKFFDLPQDRDRVYGVGIRKDLNQPFDFPAGILTSKTMLDILDPNAEKTHKIDHKFYTTVPKIKKRYLQYDRNGKGQRSQMDRVYFVDGLSPTVPAENVHPIIKLSDGTIRYANTLERKRLMGFPDDFIINLSRNQAWKVLGNSIPVNVLVAIFRNLLVNIS